MHGRIKSAQVEITVVVTSDDLSYTKRNAIADAGEYIAENHPGELWERLDAELDKYNVWSVRYRRAGRGPNESRTAGPDWSAA